LYVNILCDMFLAESVELW